MNHIPVRQIKEFPKSASPARFSIRKVEDLLDGHDLVQPLHRHDFFFMLALQKGSGFHEIDFTKYDVQDKVIFFMRPGQVHQLELKAGSTGFLMEFTPSFYHPGNKYSLQRLRRATSKKFCLVETDRFEILHTSLVNMFREFTGTQDHFQEMIRANLDIFFIEFARQSSLANKTSVNSNSYAQEQLEWFTEQMELHITIHKQVSQYAELMNLSIYQLNEITRTTVAKTASQLISDYIVMESKRYLLATTDQVKEIADHLGYEDASYFIRFFKKHTGYSPEAFRHNHA